MRPAARHALWALGIAALYLWFVDSAIASEGAAAAVVAALAVAMLARVESVAGAVPHAPLAGVLLILRRAPLAIVRESWGILGPALWRRLVRREDVRGRWIALRYAPGRPGRDEGRHAVTIVGSGLTPNAIPLAIDDARGLLVLHQLVHERDPGANDPRWPM